MPPARRSVLRSVDAVSGHPNLEWLVSLIAARDEPAFVRFCDATGGLLFGLLLLILGDTALAERILCQVYAEVKQNAGRFDKNQDNLLIWLVTITHRRALEHLCSSSDSQQVVRLTGAPGSRNARCWGVSKSAHRKLVIATLGKLSPAEQNMIQLAYFSRMTPLAISIQLRQPPDTVRACLQHGISQLYSLFKN